MEVIATVRAPAARLARTVREAALAPPDGDAVYPLVPFRFGPDSVVAGTPGPGDGPALDGEWTAAWFDSYDGPASHRPAVLGTQATIDWLDWVGDGPVTVRVLAEAGVDDASAVEIATDEHSVEVGPLPAAEGAEAIEDRPAVDPDDATRVETDAATLERLADAADIVRAEGVPIVVEDGAFRLAVTGELMEGRGSLPAEVEGPDRETRAAGTFGALTRVLEGPVTLKVVDGGPLVVRQATERAWRTYEFDVRM